MKRLLIATAAFALMMSACSNEEELASDAQSSMEQQKEDNARLIHMWEAAADEDEPIGEYADPEGKAEMEENLAEAEAEQEGQSLEELRESLSKVDEASEDISNKLTDAVNNASIRTFEMNDVIIKVMGVERSKFAHGTRIDVEYAVENTVKERRMVPLERTIIVTNDGAQVEYDRDISNLPEWDLVSDTKTEGTVSFYLEDVEPSEVASVDVIVPGVDFKRSDDEMFTVYFNE